MLRFFLPVSEIETYLGALEIWSMSVEVQPTSPARRSRGRTILGLKAMAAVQVGDCGGKHESQKFKG